MKKIKFYFKIIFSLNILLALILIGCSNLNHSEQKIITKIRVSEGLRDTILVRKIIYSNDDKKQSDELILYKNNSPKFSELTKFEYNSKGEISRQLIKETDDSVETVVNYLYENDTLKKKVINSDKEDEIHSDFNYRKGQLAEILTSFSFENEVTLFNEIYTYTENNLLSEKIDFHITYDKVKKDTLKFERVTFRFDENELLYEKLKVNVIDKIIQKEKYFYIDKLLSKTVFIDKNGVKNDSIKYEYEFNDKNIWNKKKAYSNNELIEITVRE